MCIKKCIKKGGNLEAHLQENKSMSVSVVGGEVKNKEEKRKIK